MLSPIHGNWMPGKVIVYLEVFLFLQALDFLTTLIGLKLGVSEASPFIRALIPYGPSVAVMASKIVALVLAAVCMRLKRSYLLQCLNYWYAVVVVWNFFNILAA